MALADLPLPAVVIFLGIGLFLVGAGTREGIRAFQLWRIKPVPIGDLSAASGIVVVSGTAEQIDETVRAPMTETDCLAYAWRVEGIETTRDFRGDIERSYHQLGRGRDAVRFRVSDASGSVVVDPAGASLRLAEEQIHDTAFDPTDRPSLSIDPGYDGSRLFYEARLDEGETVVVQGRVSEPDDPRLDVEKIGVQLSGAGMYVADTTQRSAMKRARRAAAVSLVLGLAVLGVLAVLLGIVPV